MPIKNVLVVRDDFLLLECVADELQDVDLTVYRAMTADAALVILNAGTELDLLFTDIRMPGSMNGWDLAAFARAQRPGIEIICASGYSDVGARLVAGSQFFSKPYRTYAILEAIQALGAGSSSSISDQTKDLARSSCIRRAGPTGH